MKKIKLTEADIHRIVRNVLKETTFFDRAEDEFENIKECYADNKDELINRLWYYIDNKPGFIEYMKSSLSYEPSEMEDDD